MGLAGEVEEDMDVGTLIADLRSEADKNFSRHRRLDWSWLNAVREEEKSQCFPKGSREEEEAWWHQRSGQKAVVHVDEKALGSAQKERSAKTLERKTSRACQFTSADVPSLSGAIATDYDLSIMLFPEVKDCALTD